MPGRPSSRFTVGRLRHRIQVQAPTFTTEDSGQVTATWSDLYPSEPAEFEFTAGGQQARGRQVEAGVKAVFTVHYRDGYSPKQRILFDGDTYHIVHVRPIQGRYRYLELHCKAIDT